MVAFNAQVHNIEMSKASIVEVVSCFSSVKARIQERLSDVGLHIKPTWISIKKTQGLREGKDHDGDLFMLDVSVLYKSCVSHLAKWITLFAEFKCFD